MLEDKDEGTMVGPNETFYRLLLSENNTHAPDREIWFAIIKMMVI